MDKYTGPVAAAIVFAVPVVIAGCPVAVISAVAFVGFIFGVLIGAHG